MKKFFSLVLALVMALSLTTVAWGATTHEVSTEAQLAELLDEDGTNDVAEGDTIKLLNNIQVQNAMHTSGTSTNGVSYTGGKSFTIDFNNCSVSADSSITNAIFRIKTSGTVTLMNGTITASDVYYGVLANGTGTINLDNMTISLTNTGGQGVAVNAYAGTVNVNDGTEITATGAYAGMEVSGTANIYEGSTVSYVGNVPAPNTYGSIGSAVGTSGGTLNIYGGELVSNATGGNTVATNSSGGTINITGGTITGETAVFALTDSYYNDPAEINISGGTINGALAKTAYGTASTEITITGGTFSSDVSDYVADGYRLVNGTVASVPANTNGVVGGYEGQLTVKGAPRQAITNFTKTAAVTPDDVNEDGLYNMPGDVIGSIEYYTFNLGGGVAQNYYEVDSVNDADLIVYVGDSLVPYMYLANEPAGGFQYWYGVASFNDFGSACGQFKYADYDATESYYVYAGQVFVLDDDGAVNLKVGTKFVQANNITASGKWVAHTPVYAQNDKGVVTGISCAKCSDVGVIVSNFAALPTAMKAPGMNFPVPGSTSKYYYWVDTAVVAPSTPSTDKVQSAETFDAGIAMYVGMSVMAAAGSAVVIGKKKD